MYEQQSTALIKKTIVNGHFVLRSGVHSPTYINKDSLYTNPLILTILGHAIAEHFQNSNSIDVVVGPTFGGVLLAHAVAKALFTSTQPVYSVFAEKNASGGFVFKRGYDKVIQGKNVLLVEDILTSGKSAKTVVKLCRNYNASIVGVGILCNRGNVTPHDLGNVPELYALHTMKLETWQAKDCPLCKENIPISQELGTGK